MNNHKEKSQLTRFYLICLIAIGLFTFINGQCNLCSSLTNLACVSETDFQVCIDGSPLGAIASCPTGYVCSTVDASICQLNQSGVVIACKDCNVCDSTGTFACTDVQSYALCLGNNTPSQLTGSCAPNHICNIEYQQICVNIAEGVAPTCSTSGWPVTTVVPTYPPYMYPQKYCQQVQQYGRFPVERNITNTCRQYIFCMLRGGVWTGGLYNCPGRTYFNSSSRLCTDVIPNDCYY